jgi:hypothetical protein
MTLADGYHLIPSQPMLGEGALIETDFTPTHPYPLQPFTWAVKEEAGGTRLILRVIPLQWNPETDAVTLLDDLAFTVDYSAPVPPTTVQVVDSEVEQPAYAVGESIGVLITLTATEAAPAGLEVRLTDPGGNLLHRHTETLDLAEGTSMASYAIPTQTFSAGTKYVEALVTEAETGNLIRGDVHAVILTGLALNPWLDRGLYPSDVTAAQLTVQVRDEAGELVNGLSSRFTVTLDDQLLDTALAQVDAGIYATSIPLVGLALGPHTLELGCLDWQEGYAAETMPFEIAPRHAIYLPLIMK